jgi:selenocysteine lyase/cysteine desulfurase
MADRVLETLDQAEVLAKARQQAAALAAKNILVVERDGFVRASPHIYNDEQDLERLLKEL